jgi:RHS repeat-associated protein
MHKNAIRSDFSTFSRMGFIVRVAIVATATFLLSTFAAAAPQPRLNSLEHTQAFECRPEITTTPLSAPALTTPQAASVKNELGTYTYDSAGRITSLTQQLYKPSNTTATSTAITATTALYTIGYDSLGRISTFSRAAGTGAANTAPLPAQSAVFTYDANGALLKEGLRSYEYDAANRLADATTGAGIDAPTTRYVHNALGQRLFKTEPLYAPVASGSNPADPGVMAALVNFFTTLWGGSTTLAAPSNAEKLGYQYFYDEDGSLLYELGAGGANSTGSAHYVYLPTPSGPLPIAAYLGNRHYAVHTDHLNTPRRLTQSNKQVAWQWAFSAFGDEQPTTGAKRYVDPTVTPNAGSTTIADVTFNLRYPGQYFDKESGLSYNYFRSYDSRTGRYTQADPIDLEGGWNRFGYVEGNPLSMTDPEGLVGLYNDGSVNMNAYPGPPAGGNEHARQGPGQNYHVHLRDSNGREVRISTETWKPLTPQDQKFYDQSKPIRNFCEGLSPGEKKFYDRVNRQVFHTGYPTINQTLRIGGGRGRSGGRSEE